MRGGCWIGNGNSRTANNYTSYIVGENNRTGGWDYIIGQNNEMTSSNGYYVLGSGMKNYSSIDPSSLRIGYYNKNPSLTQAKIIIANGWGSGEASRSNAIEIDTSTTKILSGLQLASDSTEVNAITPAQNSPASADDKTLVTKSYLAQFSSQSVSYEPNGEQHLSLNNTYSIGTLIGDNTWTFPYTKGSIDMIFSLNSLFYTAHIPIPSYLNPQNTPTIKVPLSTTHNYSSGVMGRSEGALLCYDVVSKSISVENPEGIEFSNDDDNVTSAYNYGNMDLWFWGMSCYNHF